MEPKFMTQSLRDFSSPGQGYWSDVPPELWNDWTWQMRNRITRLDQIEGKLHLSEEERAGILQANTKLAMSITPYFFNLIDPRDPLCPIRLQVIPRVEEMNEAPDELIDPLGEDKNMVVPGLVHKYPDRVLFLVTDRCPAYCRYCTRSRVVSGVGEQELDTDFELAYEYLSKHTEVRDVLLSGGDPLILSDGRLAAILRRLRQIPHIEFIRIGSRIPIFMPQRITPELCNMLREFHPLWMSVHSNHPRELTVEVRDALGRLADAGIPLGNQSVLLRGVNDDPEVMKTLVHKLLRCRVRPYYLYQCDLIKGSAHLRTNLNKGLEIIRALRGHTSGYAVPQFVVDGPGDGGKVPLNPDYVLAKNSEGLIIQNYRGDIYEYPELVQEKPEIEVVKNSSPPKKKPCCC
jgi:lysine 2,3-aminomutase